MALRTIVTLPDPVLRRKARPVNKFDKNLQILIDDMIDTMRDAPGVGLAAPQVGISERVIVVEYAEPEEVEEGEEPIEVEPKLYVMVNPEIVKSSPETVMGVEGCLSIPALVGEVERAQEVRIRGLNRHGQQMKLKVDGWLARIFQHEIDHVNGVVFTDLATQIWQPEEPMEDRV
ncbi:MAG: peptide deformylase [Anaerolineales bacterium]|jgi:peptide deformylase